MSDPVERCTLLKDHKTRLAGNGIITMFQDCKLAFPAYAILESFGRISFPILQRIEDLPKGWEASFAGRIFNTHMEFRWIADGSSFQAWTIKDSKDEHGEYEKISDHYYLYGTWGKGRFFEATVRRAALTYPIQGQPRENDRAYIDVALYRPTQPTSWPNSAASVRNWLNQPAIAAHRFMRIAF
ncbi:MAG: hypothetical protein M1418_06545 [Deltaproteobacteria bacterium]|nr:hypothetical protein [Deltaproteobacteria bacterium]